MAPNGVVNIMLFVVTDKETRDWGAGDSVFRPVVSIHNNEDRKYSEMFQTSTILLMSRQGKVLRV